MGGASGGLGLRFDGARGLWVGGFGAAGSVRADGAGGLRAGRLRAGGLDGAGGLRVGGFGAVANKTPPTLQKQAGSGGLHQIMPQRGSQGVNKAL